MIPFVVVLFGVAMAGIVGHELAHWIVWTVTGRQPALDLWRLEVRPRHGPKTTTVGDRIAAAAPYLCGAVAIAVGVLEWKALLVVFGVTMVQLPSTADVSTMVGETTWVFPE